MSYETIQFMPIVDMTGRDIARELRGVHHLKTKESWLNELLGDLDDDAYDMVIAFVKANPVPEKKDPTP